MDQAIEASVIVDASGREDISLCNVKLHVSEKKLLELIRSIQEGEISSIKIQNGLPVFYIINLKDKKFI